MTHVAVFVAAGGNQFMTDIAGWLVEATAMTGRTAELVTDRLPAVDGALNLVVAPHEFFELYDAPTPVLQRAAAASVCVGTEQPGTPWFRLTVDACRRGLRALDINPHGVTALRAAGIRTDHLRLGGVPSMVAEAAASGAPRPVDVLFMGGLDDRRGAILAELAPWLAEQPTEVRLFKFDRPVSSTTPGMVFGADKYARLAGARVLLNIHRAPSSPRGVDPLPYFEWARMVEAMANGVVVVTEGSEGYSPLVPGEHFVEAHDVTGLRTEMERLLDDETLRRQIAEAAHRMVMADLALHLTIDPILAELEADVLPRLEHHVSSSHPTRGVWRLGASKVPPPKRMGPLRPVRDLQERAKRVAMAENRALQRLDAAACLLRTGSEQQVVRHEGAAYRSARPEVTAVVTLYDYANVVTETLDSLAASVDVEFELVVVEDHATDHSREVVTEWIDRHPEVAAVLLAKEANEGLASARNDGFAAARADLVMVMDADNHVYPRCLRVLADTLTEQPAAAAAYAILEDFGVSRGVRSALAWEAGRLCAGNYIDAQAMWRRSGWEQLGGYRRDDDDVYGWEDWDLWLRLAEAGGSAIHVPQILGRYRVQQQSMITLTNLAADSAMAGIRRRYPSLPWPPS